MVMARVTRAGEYNREIFEPQETGMNTARLEGEVEAQKCIEDSVAALAFVEDSIPQGHCQKHTEMKKIPISNVGAVRPRTIQEVSSQGKRFLLVLVAAILVESVEGATLRVPDQYRTIQDAIEAATNGDLVIVSPNIYQESVNFLGKSITVASRFLERRDDVFVARTIIVPTPDCPAVTADSGETTSSQLIGFTIIGRGNFYASTIECYDSSLFVSHNRVIGHMCQAVGAWNSSLVLTENEFDVDTVGPGHITAIECHSGSPTIACNRINRDARENVEGLSLHACAGVGVSNNLISGTVRLSCSGLISHNVILAKGDAQEYGLAIRVFGCDEDCSIVNNTVIGGMVYIDSSLNPSIRNNIIAYSRVGLAATSSAVLPSYNDVWRCAQPYAGIADQTGINGNISVNPRFFDPDDHHGDFRLREGSPAIDAGDPATHLDPDGTRADLGAFSASERGNRSMRWNSRHWRDLVCRPR